LRTKATEFYDAKGLTTIAVKQFMDIGARPHVCGVLLIFVINLADGLYILSCVGAGVQK
jgi:hypothetical protein